MLADWAAGDATRVVLQEPGANIALGRNLAIARSGGEIVAVTDAGVRLDPRWLDRLAGALESDPEAAVASGFFLPESCGVFERALAATKLPSRADVGPGRFSPPPGRAPCDALREPADIETVNRLTADLFSARQR